MDITQKGIYLRIALAMQGITVHQLISEQIVETLYEIDDKGANFRLDDAVKIEAKYEKLKNKTTNEKS